VSFNNRFRVGVSRKATAMNEVVDYPFDDSDPVLPSQYNGSIRRCPSVLDGEYHLLWVVLEDEIESYLADEACATLKQRAAFEVYGWFRESPDECRGLFAFPTICDLLGIDSGMLLLRDFAVCTWEVR
jgi:hypothetical protein